MGRQKIEPWILMNLFLIFQNFQRKVLAKFSKRNTQNQYNINNMFYLQKKIVNAPSRYFATEFTLFILEVISYNVIPETRRTWGEVAVVLEKLRIRDVMQFPEMLETLGNKEMGW